MSPTTKGTAMSIQIEAFGETNLVEVTLSGKLEHEDYERFVPQVDALIRDRGRLRMLVVLEDFHGWTAGALWDDTKFAWHHFSDLERLAIVGEKTWHKGMAVFCKPFTKAQVRYFEPEEMAEARAWATASE